MYDRRRIWISKPFVRHVSCDVQNSLTRSYGQEPRPRMPVQEWEPMPVPRRERDFDPQPAANQPSSLLLLEQGMV